MGIDISQWRVVIGSNKNAALRDMTRSKEHEHMSAKEAAQDTIWNESLHFWKNAVILVFLLLGIWFFFAHTLPGDGRLVGMSSEKMSSSGTAHQVHMHFHLSIFLLFI